MTTEYQYSISGDFSPAGVDISQLQQEILDNVAITVTISYIYTNGDDLYTVFPSALSAPEKSSLDTVIANHVPNNIYNYSITQTGYIQLNSTLADAQAIRIMASDTNGGIAIDAGFGGIAVNTTNSIGLVAQAGSNFSVTGGNLVLESDAVLSLQSSGTGTSGIAIGTDVVNQTISIGTGTGMKNIAIGNTTGTTAVDINTGTGGFLVDTATGGAISLDSTGAASNFTLTANAAAQDLTIALVGAYDSSIILDSQGTGTDAIRLNSVGGVVVNSTGPVNIATGDNTGGAITLDAAFNNGGINISAGSQGIAINSNGGLIGIGGWSGGDISIGTAAVARTVTIGNATSTTTVDINTGTGGFSVDTTNGGAISLDAVGAASNFTLTSNADAQDLTISLIGTYNSSIILDSQGTGTDAIRLLSAGGIDVDSTGTINIATGDNTGGAITLDAAFNNGGINISAGTQGIAINANGGLIGIGGWSGGNIELGTAAVARSITIGNTTSTTSVVINSGTGGITIGNNANGGEIQIGNVTNAKTLIVGNSTGASRLFTRWGTGGNVKFQGAETALSDADATLTITNLLTQILTMAPSTNRTLTLPTAADIVAGISGAQVDDCIDFTIIHTSIGVSDPYITLSMGTGGTATGYMVLHPYTNNAGTYFSSGSASFRLRLTNVTPSTEAYTCYRTA